MRASCSAKQAKTMDYADRWGRGCRIEFSCVYSQQLDNNEGAMRINTMLELMVRSAYFITGTRPRSPMRFSSAPSACHP